MMEAACGRGAERSLPRDRGFFIIFSRLQLARAPAKGAAIPYTPPFKLLLLGGSYYVGIALGG